ncbi:hypothetical protein OK016_17145 [Vibrio chagasii]|nr:hypothetical protein [Vibrio chagasii]
MQDTTPPYWFAQGLLVEHDSGSRYRRTVEPISIDWCTVAITFHIDSKQSAAGSPKYMLF